MTFPGLETQSDHFYYRSSSTSRSRPLWTSWGLGTGESGKLRTECMVAVSMAISEGIEVQEVAEAVLHHGQIGLNTTNIILSMS